MEYILVICFTWSWGVCDKKIALKFPSFSECLVERKNLKDYSIELHVFCFPFNEDNLKQWDVK
jgi:hypothetical protein